MRRRGQPLTRREGCGDRLLLAAVAAALGCATQTGEVELRVSDNNPSGSPPALALDYWAEQVTQQTRGKLRLAVYHDGVLLEGNQQYQGVKAGIADVSYYTLNRDDGFDLNSVAELPFMGWPDHVKAEQIYLDLLRDYPAMNAEWKGVKIIGVMMMPGTQFHNIAKEVRTPADLAGLNTVATDQVTVDSARAAGAVVLELDVAKIASALRQGTVKAALDRFSRLAAFQVLETLKYHTVFAQDGINMATALLIMNNDVFDSLPSDVQDVVAASGTLFRDQLYSLDVAYQASAIAQAQAWGHSFVQLSPDEIAVWSDLVRRPVHDTWITTCEAFGLPARELYADALQRIQAAAVFP
jgi:TRAP-type C4-dicarboxylate transport system substrate-binding protein